MTAYTSSFSISISPSPQPPFSLSFSERERDSRDDTQPEEEEAEVLAEILEKQFTVNPPSDTACDEYVENFVRKYLNKSE